MHTFFRTFAILALLGLAQVQAASPWSTNLRATWVATTDKSDAFSALGLQFAPNAISTRDKLIPEFDVDYAFSKDFSAELVLTIPQKMDVDLAGVGHLGSFSYLPPTLLLRYHPQVSDTIQPYIGAGINYTLIWKKELSVAGVPLDLDDNSFGLATQAGVNFRLSGRWSLNLDLKYVLIRSDVFAGAAKLTTARLDPILYSVGVNYQY